MNESVTITTNGQGSLVVSSLDFAVGLAIQHKNLLESIRTHRAAIEAEFGPIDFTTIRAEEIDSTFQTANPSKNKKSTKPLSIAYLTEDQALAVGALSRNSNRVVEFKLTLVKSFAQARKKLTTIEPVVSPSIEQVLIQLVSQTNQLMQGQQQLLAELRADVDGIMQGRKSGPIPRSRPGKQLPIPGIPVPGPSAPPTVSLRLLINRRIDDYCSESGYDRRDTWTYLYRRLFEVYTVNVHRLNRAEGESLLDAIERYGRLNDLYKLVVNELPLNSYDH